MADQPTHRTVQGTRRAPGRVMDRIHPDNPYDGADLDHVPVDLQGWNSRHGIFKAVIGHVKPRLIVEVGTWKGASAIYMAEICKDLDLSEVEIVCIDTWLGSPGAWIDRTGNIKALMQLKNGYPQVYWTFLKNIIAQGHTDVITPLPLHSEGGFFALQQMKVQADLVYIDAGHEYETVKRDLANFVQILGPGGVIIGDDLGWDSVERAAKDFSAESGVHFVPFVSKYLMTTDADQAAHFEQVFGEALARREAMMTRKAEGEAATQAEDT